MTRRNNNPLGHLTRTAWTYAREQRSRFVFYIILSAASIAVSLLDPIIIGKLLNRLQQPNSGSDLLYDAVFYLSLYLLTTFLFWCLHGPSRVMERDVAFHIRTNYQMDLFHKLTALPLRWHKDHHSGSTIERVSKAVTSLNEFCDSGFETIHILARFVGAVIALCWFLPASSVAVALGTSIIVLIVILCDRVLVKQYDALNEYWQHTAAAIHDYLTNITTVISLRLADLVSKEVRTRTERPYRTYRKNVILNELKWFITSMLVNSLIAGILFWYCFRVIAQPQEIMIGTAFTLFDYLRRIGDSFYGFAWKYGTLVSNSSKVRAAESISRDYESEVGEREHAQLPADWQKVEIKRLNFSHSENQQNLFDIEIKIEKGKHIALVGESGSGKSTLLTLIRGLVEANHAHVECDGTPLPFGLLHTAHHSTLIPQDPEIFSESVSFNVSLGVSSDPESIMKAIRQARFENVLPRLAKGIDTNVAEKGVNLSGGEKQRLALARGIFFAEKAASDIILLDESTSSVDLINERIIFRTLLKVFRKSCVVSAIHKLHLVPMFDEIYVLENGRVLESGTFETLIKARGHFAKLWIEYQQEVVVEDSAD